VKAGAAWTWALLSYSVPVPLGVLVILALPFAGLLVIVAWAALTKKATTPQQPFRAEPALDDLERGVLQLLARADGRFVAFDDAANRLHTSRLLLERACQALDRHGFIEPHRDILHGTQLALTARGRDFVIEQGFVQR
jgi:hypothetical protein